MLKNICFNSFYAKWIWQQMAKINWRHIEIFHAVMTSGNLTQAAALLNTSQPTVSRELARLEKQLGLRLFARVRGRLQPTVQGLRLFEEVQRSWYGLDRIMEAADGLRQFRQGELSVACLPVFSQSLLPPLVQPFMQRYPDVSLNIIPQESPLLEEWLSAQRYDLGLTETQHAPAGTERLPLLTCDEVCVLPQDHPLCARAVLTPQDFAGENYVSLSRADSYRQLLDTLFHEQGVERRPALDYADSGVVMRRFSVAVPFTVSLVRPLHRPASALVAAFVDHLQAQVADFPQRIAERLA